MKKFIYAKQRGFISYQPSTGTQAFKIKGAGVSSFGEFFDHTFSDNSNVRARLKVTITSAGNNTGNRGANYSSTDTVAGEKTVLLDGSIGLNGDNLGISSSGDNKYVVQDNDLVEIQDCFTSGLGEAMFRADRLITIIKPNALQTDLRFKSIERSEGAEYQTDDIIEFHHADVSFKEHIKMIKFFESYINNYNKNNTGILMLDRSLDKSSSWPKELKSVYRMIVKKETN